MRNGERGELTAGRSSWSCQGVARAGAVASLALVLGACSVSGSTTRAVNTEKAEEVIRTFLEEKVESPVDEVSCPEREARQGDVFECTARVDGQTVRFRITQNDNRGNVDVQLAQALLDVKQAVSFIEQEVEKAKGVPVRADCGAQRYLVKDPGTTFDCRMTGKSTRANGRVIVTVRDIEGNVDLRLA